MDKHTVLRTAQAIGLSSSFTLFGISFCSSQLVIPLLPPLGTAAAAVAFREFYYTGARVFVPIALLAGAAWAVAAYLAPKADSQRTGYAAASVAMLGTGVFTAAFMLGVNDRLVDISYLPEAQMARGEVLELLGRWKVLNFVRSGICFVAGLAGLVVLLD